jgi:hypothetical protein
MGGPPAYELDEELTTSLRKKAACCEMLCRSSEMFYMWVRRGTTGRPL